MCDVTITIDSSDEESKSPPTPEEDVFCLNDIDPKFAPSFALESPSQACQDKEKQVSYYIMYSSLNLSSTISFYRCSNLSAWNGFWNWIKMSNRPMLLR